jgi:hypothetical protein
MGLDFVALMTGTEIRQALDVLELRSEADTSPEAAQAIATVRARVEELETRLNTARRTAWVAVPVEAETITPGDVIVAKDGALWSVRSVNPSIGAGDATVTIGAVAGDRAPMTWPVPIARPVPVLRRPTADALDILSRQLGAQVNE